MENFTIISEGDSHPLAIGNGNCKLGLSDEQVVDFMVEQIDTKPISSVASVSTPNYREQMENGGLSSSKDDAGTDPVCIVGIGCRLPGGIRSPSDLWDLLVQKRSGQCRVPKERFNIDGFYHPEGDRAGVMDSDGGYFLHQDVRQFDNAFFGINNLEATYMDPQQRQLLEVVFECFENAGASMDQVSGANIGVYVGNFTVDFPTNQMRDPDYTHRYTATGSATAIMSNRISHVFNLQGPSFTLDTACSSSIYGLHQAVLALRARECDGAVVAGANLVTAPEQFLGTSKGGVLSATSACHTFDKSADGYGRAEAVGALYLKRLSLALRDGDKIRAIIRGSAVNSNGKTPGITQPSSKLQEAVIRKAYQDADLSFEETDYVECHGTGTAVGDPIEVAGVGACFSPRKGVPLLIGSVKTNIGHGEAASGISSIIKVILAFEHGKIPPTYGLTEPNPALNLEKFDMKIASNLEDWPTHVRRAGVNSFGFGGANAHVILEAFESYMSSHYGPPSEDGPLLDPAQTLVLPFSASSLPSLQSRVQDLQAQLASGARYDLANLSFTLGSRRSHLKDRGFLLARPSSAHLDIVPENLVTRAKPASRLALGFVFTGQGAQYAGMGRELLESSTTFSDSIRRLDEVLSMLPDATAPTWTLRGTILEPKATSMMNDVTRSQPLTTALQIGLVDMLQGWGIFPAAVVGHSSGEIAAAYASGHLSAAQAILAAYYRGYAVGKCTLKGAMLAAGIGSETALSLIKEKNLEDHVTVACVNSPESITLSGTLASIDILLEELQRQGRFARKLETGGRAYHSHMMKEIGAEYEDLVSRGLALVPRHTPDTQADVKWYSSVACGPDDDPLRTWLASSGTSPSPGYWRDNLESPVQFSSAVQNLLADSEGYHLIEIGPHSAVKGYISQLRKHLGLSQESLPYTPSLLRAEDATKCVKSLAGTLFLYHYSVDFSRVNELGSSPQQPPPSHICDLPPYCWNYTDVLWREPRASAELRSRRYPRHELLGSQQLAGNGIDWAWRNRLQLNEIPWMADHMLESQIVFPGAGYIALAIEAMCQLRGFNAGQASGLTFEFRDVNILTAHVIQIGETDTELHTTMSARKLSTSTASDIWYNFAVSSWSAGTSMKHCAGSIRVLQEASQNLRASASVEAAGLEEWSSTQRWYEKWHAEGLCFGPHFRSITSLQTDRSRSKPEGISTTELVQRVKMDPESSYPGTFYHVHPLVIDACFQAAIMGGTAGNLTVLKAWLPVFISECRIAMPNPSHVGDGASIHTRTKSTGFSTRRADCTLMDPSGAVVIDMKDARLSLYTGKAEPTPGQADEEGRHPFLQVVWKPDVSRVDPRSQSQLQDYVDGFLSAHPDMADNESVAVTAALLDLLGHKNPRLRVLHLGSGCDCRMKMWLGILDNASSFSRYQSWDQFNLVDGKLDYVSGGDDAKGPTAPELYDVVLLPDAGAIGKYFEEASDELMSRVGGRGVVVGRHSSVAEKALVSRGFSILSLSGNVMLASRSTEPRSLAGRELILIGNPSKSLTPLAQALEQHFLANSSVSSVAHLSLADIQQQLVARKTIFSAKTIVISLLEAETSFLPTMGQEEMDVFRSFATVVTDLVWVTGAGMLSGKDANLTLSSGLSRALMFEHPSLRFSVLDLGNDLSRGNIVDEATAQGICFAIQSVLVKSHEMDDFEFIRHNGLLHVSRFSPDEGLNSVFRNRASRKPEQRALSELGKAQLDIRKPGLLDTICFNEVSEPPAPIPAGYVDVDIKAVSLNAKDVYVLSAKVETKNGTSGLEFAGIVSAVASDVTSLRPGDRVVVLAPHYFGTIERVPAWACHKMLPSEDFGTVATLPVIYCTALYALNDRARLRPGESILVHSGAGAFGMACIALAQRLRAVVYTTVSTPEKASFLISRFNLPREHIFQSRDSSFVDAVRSATQARGVDVVVNSLVGDLMHASWDCIADFGRFVEVGKRELIDAGRLDMSVFLRNATFTAFDMSELFYHKDECYRDILAEKMKETLTLYRAKAIDPVPIAKFDISEITQAYRHFLTRGRVGKVVVCLENPRSRVPTVPSKYKTMFHADKVYILIGCLGGLGRSLTKWMMLRGARNFVFLGRSGCDKPSARDLVSQLGKAGANVKVIRGDVANQDDVTATVDAATSDSLPIGGVVQAAMGLHESLFSNMPNSAWHTGVQPKWHGTWNIHNALSGREEHLDFFLLTSSISGSVGTATESNYCASNGFLDAFARWRRSVARKPAVSIGLGMISEVGYLHENPEIESLLLRKGIQPLNEDEFLQVVDLALAASSVDLHPSHNTGASGDYDPLARSHVLTGMEPLSMRRLIRDGFAVDNGTLRDPRASILSKALDTDRGEAAGSSGAGGSNKLATADWCKGLPAAAVKSLAAESDAESLVAAVLRLMRMRFSALILLPVDQIDDTKPLAEYGMDSMIAAEYRTWFWNALQVDVPYLDILSQTNSLKRLAGFVEQKLTEGRT